MWAYDYDTKKQRIEKMVQGTGFEPVKHKAPVLQTGGFNHSPTPALLFLN